MSFFFLDFSTLILLFVFFVSDSVFNFVLFIDLTWHRTGARLFFHFNTDTFFDVLYILYHISWYMLNIESVFVTVSFGILINSNFLSSIVTSLLYYCYLRHITCHTFELYCVT